MMQQVSPLPSQDGRLGPYLAAHAPGLHDREDGVVGDRDGETRHHHPAFRQASEHHRIDTQ